VSADNCVAILATKIYPEAKEYQEWRVCVAQAIGNVFKNDYYMHQYFKNSPVFDMYENALFVAHQLELDRGPTDMGVVIVKHPLGKTWDEIVAKRSYVKRKSKDKRK
jgi:hypothetical protein